MLMFCRAPDQAEYPSGTTNTSVDNALSFLLKTVPDFPELVKNRSVLDFGCGFGHQATAIARDYDAEVVGLDLPRPALKENWDRLLQQYPLPNLKLTTDLPAEKRFDLVYSCSSFEHFDDPAAILRMMRDRLKPEGKVVISFAEPWYSNSGSHMDGFCRLPWVNLLFSERTVMSVRSRYRSDGAVRYEDVEGGLNRMTVARFERIIKESGMRIEWFKLWSTRGLPAVTEVPVLRELLTSACSCILSNR